MKPLKIMAAMSAAALGLTCAPTLPAAAEPAPEAATAATSLPPDRSLPPDPFFAYDRPAEYGVHRERVTVPLRDGSHLACDLHRPATADGTPAPGRFPASSTTTTPTTS
ncbi:hypothetical protein [Nonomuraea sp. NPDC003709]|uniref:hypothetical protein n=1 Tax=Nonomuraea sp. NPDC003709 TaxID=3154450 RepID=UPI0033B85A70